MSNRAAFLLSVLGGPGAGSRSTGVFILKPTGEATGRTANLALLPHPPTA
jgi:hypothetical protein